MRLMQSTGTREQYNWGSLVKLARFSSEWVLSSFVLIGLPPGQPNVLTMLRGKTSTSRGITMLGRVKGCVNDSNVTTLVTVVLSHQRYALG